jgi:hypothetical protein
MRRDMGMSGANAHHVWQDFCDRYKVASDAVPLFHVDDRGFLRTKVIGRGDSQRSVLARAAEMEALIRGQVRLLVEDWQSGRREYDGLIYCMGHRTGGLFEPLYIGKAETLGKGHGNLSVNLQRLETDTSKFARWGDNYAYHVGDLSACVLPGHPADKAVQKYQRWAKALFAHTPSAEPRLVRPVHFWSMAWKGSNVGVWKDLGATRLTFLEYMLVGVASMAFPQLLNHEGVNRQP